MRKDPIDRLCGAGTWARDPDALLLLTPHEEPKCYTVTSVLRHLPEQPEFVVQWGFPLMRRAASLDAHALRGRAGRHKRCTDREFLDTVLGQETLLMVYPISPPLFLTLNERTHYA